MKPKWNVTFEIHLPSANHHIIIEKGKWGLWPLLWSSGQSSWLQIQRSGFDSRRYQIFWEVVGLERGPLSLVRTIEELLGSKSSGSGLEISEYGHRDLSSWPRETLFPQKLALPTTGGRLVGIVLSQTQATEFSFLEGVHSELWWTILVNKERKHSLL
jgi:hypothetical protein